jgi:hypothetical protein
VNCHRNLVIDLGLRGALKAGSSGGEDAGGCG